MDYSLPYFSAHGSFQARILEWVAISFLRGSSWPRDQTCVSCIGRWILYHWPTTETRKWLNRHALKSGIRKCIQFFNLLFILNNSDMDCILFTIRSYRVDSFLNWFAFVLKNRWNQLLFLFMFLSLFVHFFSGLLRYINIHHYISLRLTA